MNEDLLRKAINLNRRRKFRKGWQSLVRTLALCVVFCTTYVLILPAITMQEEPVCGIEAHTHTDACYAQPLTGCVLPADGVVAHLHGDMCRNDAGILVCTLEEKALHTHDDSCYALTPTLACPVTHVHTEACRKTEKVLTCTLPETEGHVHSESCSGTQLVQVCTAEIHTHGEDCFQEQTLVCEIPESEGHTHSESCSGTRQVQVCTDETHQHTESCFQEQTLTCEIPEKESHTHSESCSGTQLVQVCTAEIHSHGEDCFQEQTLICEIPETQGHVHEESCYTVTEIPCTEPTAEEHVHEDACWQQTSQLICTLPELQLHSHGEGCYDAEGNLTCTLPVVVEHIHSEACVSAPENGGTVLVCTLQEHTHEEACYPLEEAPVPGLEFTCGYAVHTHIDSCYRNDGSLACTIPEHTHNAECAVTDLDLTADVETEEDWMRSVSGMTLTGNWPADLLAVAETQLDYAESVKNVVLAGDTLKGYTRYGAWYGDPYADWNTLFAAFCLEYAAVEDFPVETDAALWVETLIQEERFKTPDSYSPKPGDLVFLDLDQSVKAPVPEAEAQEETPAETREMVPDENQETVPVAADQVGIVAELVAATEETPAQLKLIAGDCQDRVSYVAYDLADPVIIGYGEIPTGDIQVKTFEGTDFTVTVTCSREAAIPGSAELTVREILPDTEEYEVYYIQSQEALMQSVCGEEHPAISFARFFDISFVDGGMPIEPAAPVDVEIVYSETIPVKEEENSRIVHFAKEGVEVLYTDTHLTESGQEEKTNLLSEIAEHFAGETEKVDTFRFTQRSFSVTGTVVANTRAITIRTATQVNPWEINNTGKRLYVLYTQINGRYYALSGAANSYPVEITVNGNTVTLPADNAENLLWTFVDKANDNTAYLYSHVANLGTGRYLHPFNNGSNNQNITTSNPYDLALVVSNNTVKVRGANNNHIRFADAWSKAGLTTNVNNATSFYVAELGDGAEMYNVWFDGTLGGMMSYHGAANENIPAAVGSNGQAVVELPEVWQSSTKYAYKLQGWYDIKNHQYYAVNPDDNVQPTATITGDTVFYADWIAATYDVGQNNSHVVDSVDTNDFITTHVFDYNALFNMMSQTHTGTVTAANHNETWSIVNNGTVPYGNNMRSLGFSFVDYDANGELSYASGRDNTNTNQGDAITAGILSEVYNASGQDLLDLLFNPNTPVIGKYYAGTGNYLFQYMDSTTENYDGVHDGYYYLDARLNAASYHQTYQRFYLYDYLERTSDSNKDGGVGQYSDFLPFNSPYLFESHQLDEYTDSIRRPGYEYDAKDGGDNHPQYNSLDDAATNYFFGIRSDIEFFLPNDAGYKDDYDNYGNISTRGEHMVFDFHGDDDVWVFIDGELVLDIGGLHGVMFGQIDFSTGTVTSGKDGTATTTRTFQQLLGHNITEGTHTMTVYYMERGSSQSNCAIYFNIAPRFDLQITKEDVYSAETLENAEFTIYTCEGCANVCDQCRSGSCTNEKHQANPVTSCPVHGTNLQYAELWNSQEEHILDMDDGVVNQAIHTMKTNASGVASCWGLSAGKTYYIKETEPPTVYNPAYPRHDDVIRITLNNRGTASIETTTLHGTDAQITQGYAVIEQDVDNTLKLVSLTITNQQEHETTKVRVKKQWADGATDLPNSIIAYLMKDGVKVGREAVLNDANGWTYTWEGLPKYELDATNTPVEIQYTVGEIQVPGYTTRIDAPMIYQDHIDWIKTEYMEDSATYLLVNGSGALAYNGRNFYWMDAQKAKGEDPNYRDANWYVTTLDYGFRLQNESGYYLAFNRSGSVFTGTTSATGLNQVIYYLENRLVAHDNDIYYQLYNINGQSAAADGLTFELIRKDVINGTGFTIENVPITYDGQTFVEVNKVWADNLDHSQDSVTVHLYADGVKTNTSLVLKEKNNWYGILEGLPLKNAYGEEIVYTFEEDEPSGYDAEYQVSSISKQLVTWIRANGLSVNETYRIADGAEALGITTTGALQVARNNANDERQWWTPVRQGTRTVLKSYGMNVYLKVNGSTLTTVSTAADASAVSLNGNILSFRVGNTSYYLQMTNTSVSVTTQSNNATALNVMQRSTQQLPGTSVQVTNVEEVVYELPETGGPGTFLITFGGWLMIAAACVYYVTYFGRKRQRGGACDKR